MLYIIYNKNRYKLRAELYKVMAKNDPSAGTVYQLKETLMDISPPIWRRIQVKGAITLIKLHTVLQVVMGWEDYHLHQFEIDGISYTNPLPGDPVPNELGQEDERRRRLNRRPSTWTRSTKHCER